MYQTKLEDAQGMFVLHPAQTAQGEEPGAPGLVTIGSATPSSTTVLVGPLASLGTTSSYEVTPALVSAISISLRVTQPKSSALRLSDASGSR